jgi:hypothetical protein
MELLVMTDLDLRKSRPVVKESGAATLSDGAATGRRRCRIPEHRKQIKAMQKWNVYLQGSISNAWTVRENDRLKAELLQRDVYKLQHCNRELLAALKALVASYDGIRDGITSPVVLAKLAAADAAITAAEAHS